MLMPAGPIGEAEFPPPLLLSLRRRIAAPAIYRIVRQLLTRMALRPRVCAGLKRAAMDDLIADFLTETNESIADLDVALVKLERTPDDAGDAVADLPPGPHDQGHLRLPRPAAAGAGGACRPRTCWARCATAC